MCFGAVKPFLVEDGMPQGLKIPSICRSVLTSDLGPSICKATLCTLSLLHNSAHLRHNMKVNGISSRP